MIHVRDPLAVAARRVLAHLLEVELRWTCSRRLYPTCWRRADMTHLTCYVELIGTFASSTVFVQQLRKSKFLANSATEELLLAI